MARAGQRAARRGALALCVAIALAGCATEDFARQAGAGGTAGVIAGLGNPKNKDALADARRAILGDLDLQKAAQDLARATTLGAAAGLSELPIEELSQRFIHALMSTVQKDGNAAIAELAAQMGPALQTALDRAISGAILSSGAPFKEVARRDLQAASAALVSTSVKTFFETLDQSSAASKDQLGAVAGRIAHDAMQEAMAGLKAGLTPTDLRSYTREAGAGFAEGLKDGFPIDLSSRLEHTLISVTVGLAVVLMFLGGAVVWLRYHLLRGQKSLSVIAEQINRAPHLDELTRTGLKHAIYEAATKNGIQGWLSSFLKERGL